MQLSILSCFGPFPQVTIRRENTTGVLPFAFVLGKQIINAASVQL